MTPAFLTFTGCVSQTAPSLAPVIVVNYLCIAVMPSGATEEPPDSLNRIARTPNPPLEPPFIAFAPLSDQAELEIDI
jgi:hypothetical protein